MPDISVRMSLNRARARLQDCRSQLRECERAFQVTDFTSGEASEFEEAGEQLGYLLRMAHLSICVVFDAINLPHLWEGYIAEFGKFNGNLGKIGHNPDDPEQMYSEPLIFLDQFISTIGPVLDAPEDKSLSSRRTLLGLLKETPTLLRELQIVPTKEVEVRRPMLSLIHAVFPSAVREVCIPQPVKNYRVDIGIRELKVGVEFKFATDETQLKMELDGIFSDMRGYSGSADFTDFFAVFYTAGPIVSEARIQAAFKVDKPDFRWTPIVVSGAQFTKKPRQQKVSVS